MVAKNDANMTISPRVRQGSIALNSVVQQPVRAKAYCAYLNLRDLRRWSACTDVLFKCLHAGIVEVEKEVVSPSIVPSGDFAELNRTVTCMVLKANDRRTSCPCHDEFRGPRSDYVNRTATAGSDVVQSGRPIFDDFFQHLWPYIGNNTANVVFQMVKRLWLIRIDQ
ncbi:hypothetical protein TNCV_4714761 [Trichonephila clavipes]|nr:hypothetical protein TNCV_4714761 [Trichonephila clavipes]